MEPFKLVMRMVCGRPLWYPDCKMSEALLDVMGKKALREHEVVILRAAGVQLDVRDESAK